MKKPWQDTELPAKKRARDVTSKYIRRKDEDCRKEERGKTFSMSVWRTDGDYRREERFLTGLFSRQWGSFVPALGPPLSRNFQRNTITFLREVQLLPGKSAPGCQVDIAKALSTYAPLCHHELTYINSTYDNGTNTSD